MGSNVDADRLLFSTRFAVVFPAPLPVNFATLPGKAKMQKIAWKIVVCSDAKAFAENVEFL
jgi:hypothetical protein